VRLIDPTKTLVTGERTEHGDNIRRREHHDGSVDVTVRLKAVAIVAGAPPSKPLVKAVAELEAATAEWRVAKHSDEDGWRRFAAKRLRVANDRLLEVQ
jgi:hypothetical protein